MSQIVQKWKKVFKCVDKSSKGSLIENDYLESFLESNDEFKFEKETHFKVLKEINPIYNDYDNLQHTTLPLPKTKPANSALKDLTNIKQDKIPKKKPFTMKPICNFNTKTDENNNFNYSELYNNKNILIESNTKQRNENLVQSQVDDIFYCEIPDNQEIFTEDEPLIHLKQNQTNKENKEQTYNRLMLSDSKMNLFTKFEMNDQNNDETDMNSKSLTELRELNTFQNHFEAFHWYLNLMSDKMSECIRNDKNIIEEEKSKRLNIITAHLLYAKNFYEMRINDSNHLKLQLDKYHPCLIALACFLDSDAVRIVESHSCTCDTYVYLFSTRLKFCAWKSKMYIILKRPRRSSIERLNLIEDLKNCHKIIQEK